MTQTKTKSNPDLRIPTTPSPVPLEFVDRMSGPILGFFGEDDELVGTEPVQRLGEQLAGRDGVQFDYTIYENTGHGFMRHSAFDPEHEWYESAISSWLRMLEFLRGHCSAT